MASAWIIKREGPRWLVRYRRGGGKSPQQYDSSWTTEQAAKTRRREVENLLAAGRDPREERERVEAPTVRQVAEEWAALKLAPEVNSDLRPSTRTVYRAALVTLLSQPIAKLRVDRVTAADCVVFMAACAQIPRWQGDKPRSQSSLKHIKQVAQHVLDHAGIDPNPMRSRLVTVPKDPPLPRELRDPPTGAQVDAVVAALSPARHVLPTLLIADTGLRASEALGLCHGDVNRYDGTVLVRSGKTANAERFVRVSPDLLEEVLGAHQGPQEASAPLFPGLTLNALYLALRRASEAAGVEPHIWPHRLRHRWASVKHAEGMPLAEIAHWMGHEKDSFTLRKYTHVILGDDR